MTGVQSTISPPSNLLFVRLAAQRLQAGDGLTPETVDLHLASELLLAARLRFQARALALCSVHLCQPIELVAQTFASTYGQGNQGGFNRSAQHLSPVYPQACKSPRSCRDADSGAARLCSSPVECNQRDPCSWGSTGIAGNWCFHSCHAVRGSVDHRSRPVRLSRG